eukprot:1156520-Pelagomonas_calceolata.AAC.2
MWDRLTTLSPTHGACNKVERDICAINQNKYEDKGELQLDDISHLASVVRKFQAFEFSFAHGHQVLGILLLTIVEMKGV